MANKYVIAFIVKNKCGYETQYHYCDTYREIQCFFENNLHKVISWYPGKFIKVLYAGLAVPNEELLERTFTCKFHTWTTYKEFSVKSDNSCSQCDFYYFQ